MTARRLTALAIVLAVALLAGYDVAIYLRAGVDATISRVLLSAAEANPIIPFAGGVLCGHLFWAQPKPQDGQP